MTFSGTIGDSSTKVLIITAYRWPTTTRLALALFEAGVAIEALCPVGHSLAGVAFVSKVYRYQALRPLRSLRSAIAASKPDLIIPTDDTVAALLHDLYKRTNAMDSARVEIRSVIARSLGDPVNYPMFYSRARFASLAHVAGVLSPQTTNIRDHVELVEQLE